MSDRPKDVEILALRHQITVLERHLHGERARFTWQIGPGAPPCHTSFPATHSGRCGRWSAPKPCSAGT